MSSYTQLSRRAARLNIRLKWLPQKGALDVVVDSTGVKVFGEGEWKVRQHGPSKRRQWRKLHIAVDPLDHEILAIEMTPSSKSDSQVFEPLIDSIKNPLERIFQDGAYDTSDCYRKSHERGSQLITPPRKNAILQWEEEPSNWKAPRDKAIQRMQELNKHYTPEESRKIWKEEVNYHQRSLRETAMYRLKKLMGSFFWSRNEASQKQETLIKINLINEMTALGMPDSTPVIG